jgi:methionyl-tRNA formyltransferase
LRQPDDSPSGGQLTQTAGELVDGVGGLVNTGAGLLQLVEVQPEGKGVMTWREFANGARPAAGEHLG